MLKFELVLERCLTITIKFNDVMISPCNVTSNTCIISEHVTLDITENSGKLDDCSVEIVVRNFHFSCM